MSEPIDVDGRVLRAGDTVVLANPQDTDPDDALEAFPMVISEPEPAGRGMSHWLVRSGRGWRPTQGLRKVS